jgi:hypothetical protein
MWPWSLSPLPQRPNLHRREGASGPFAETITIRPDAITENRSRPCRELNYHRTPNHRRHRSRFGEGLGLSRRKHRSASARYVIPPLFRHRPANPELHPALAIAFEMVKVRGDPVRCSREPRKVLFNPRHTIFKFTGRKQ